MRNLKLKRKLETKQIYFWSHICEPSSQKVFHLNFGTSSICLLSPKKRGLEKKACCLKNKNSFELHQASSLCVFFIYLCFFHEAIADTSFAVHTSLPVCLHSKHSSKFYPGCIHFLPLAITVNRCLFACFQSYRLL